MKRLLIGWLLLCASGCSDPVSRLEELGARVVRDQQNHVAILNLSRTAVGG